MAPPKHRQCGSQQVNERLYELDPKLRGKQARIEDECRRAIEKGVAQRVWRKLVTIQVVVHVVYKTDEENISDEQIESQIEVLNEDYRGTNPDRENVPAPWTSLTADPNIQFALATKDPKGKPTTGINRVRDDARLLRHRRLGQDEGRRRHAAVGDRPLPQHLGLQPRRRPARLRAVPRRPGADRRRRDPLHRVRHHGRRRRAVQPRPHRRPTRSATGSTSATSGATPTTAPAPTRSPTPRARPRPTTASRSGPTSPATTAPTATCS